MIETLKNEKLLDVFLSPMHPAVCITIVLNFAVVVAVHLAHDLFEKAICIFQSYKSTNVSTGR